jgi:hypothetical protein
MLDRLPDEVLIRVLAGAGCHGLCAAASSCRRLAALKVVARAAGVVGSAPASARAVTRT